MSALADLGIKLDSGTIRQRLATALQDATTLRALLKVAERAERKAAQLQQTTGGAHAS